MEPIVPLPSPHLGDGVVVVREIEERDAAAFSRAALESDVPRRAYHRNGGFTPVDVGARIARARAKREAGEQIVFATADPGSDELIGLTMLFALDWQNRVVEIGFWAAPWSRGGGTCSRAVQLTVQWAFEGLGLQRVQAFTDADNEPAQRLLGRVGFRREGVHRGLALLEGVRIDQMSFARLDTD